MATHIIKPTKFEELTAHSMVAGIGRKATDEELINYLSKGQESEAIDIDDTFSEIGHTKPII